MIVIWEKNVIQMDIIFFYSDHAPVDCMLAVNDDVWGTNAYAQYFYLAN